MRSLGAIVISLHNIVQLAYIYHRFGNNGFQKTWDPPKLWDLNPPEVRSCAVGVSTHLLR